ncbi:MAG TPA: hypothetical protein VHM70_08675 [Polyangiaceae bacterium]|jgi:hypothetical protein|nr:hypothetical protein [Polyangiaceae bacterium]
MPNQRRDAAPATHSATPEKERSFRLRHLLVVGVVGLAFWQLGPRAKAAWTLRERATQLADYALCMAGPTAPDLVRERKPEFGELVRRRLLIAAPDAQPFAKCAPFAEALTGSTQISAAHLAKASQFVEYGVEGRDGTDQGLRLSALDVSIAALGPWVAMAWPFERRAVERLIVPSSHAKEAPHPVAFPAPLSGTGLDANPALYRSAWTEQGRWFLARGQGPSLSLLESPDLGQSWRPAPLRAEGLERNAGRCTDGSSENAFAFESSPGALLVHSLMGERIAHSAELKGEYGIVAASCDRGASALALEPANADRAQGAESRVLILCPHLGSCGQMPTQPGWLSGAFDVARIEGVTVLTTISQGVVRVRSSRDNGQTWTSPTIAYDWKNPTNPQTDVKVPVRLLKLGGRLLLHGEARRGQTYPLLFSDDYGASWRGQSEASARAVATTVTRAHATVAANR